MDYRPMSFPGFCKKALTLSYDDGTIFDKKLIEIMSKHGLKGTFNINSSFIGVDDEYCAKYRRLHVEELPALYEKNGIEVAVHGVKHLSLPKFDSAIQLKEILDDREALEKTFGKVVKGMAYAYGAYDDDVVRRLKDCGIEYARTVISTEKFDIPTDWLRLPATCHHDNPRLMQLADEFLADEDITYYYGVKPKLFYLWGHSYEFNDHNNWEVIEAFAEKVGGKADVWYATNGEIYEYVKAYENLRYSVDGKLIHNPTATDVYMSYQGQTLLIPAGKTVKSNIRISS